MKEKLDQQGPKLKILHLKENILPRGLVPLEELFDQNDVAKRLQLAPVREGIEELNIGTIEHPKMIKLSKTLSLGMKIRYLELFIELSKVFSLGYEDLKVYDKEIIQHIILIKKDQTPFKQKLQRTNPVFIPLIEKEVRKLFDVGNTVPLHVLD